MTGYPGKNGQDDSSSGKSSTDKSPFDKNSREQLGERIERQVARRAQAERDRRTVLAQSVYMGVLGLLFVLPVVGGAYLGRWLDSLMSGYSLRWTLSLIMVGLVVGAVNVYLFIRD